MRFLLLCSGVLLWAAWLVAQGTPENQEAKNAPMTSVGEGSSAQAAGPGVKGALGSEEVTPDTPVVTVKGVCEQAPKGDGGKGCKTEVTRAQIETVINVLEPTASPTARRQLAINYARLFAAAGEAEKQHLEKDPEVIAQLAVYQKLIRMQVLADKLYRQIEVRANNVSPAVIRKYYAEHAADFEQGEVRRLSLPKTVVAPGAEVPQIALLKAMADGLRARAAAGEDFDELQLAAYIELGIKTGIPPTKLGMVRPPSLPSAERGVFDLEAGQVTPVVDLPNELVVLKLVSKESVPLVSAQAEIAAQLEPEQVQKEMRKASESGNAEFNLKYFGLSAVPELFPPPQVTGLLTEKGMHSNYAQRNQRTGHPMMPRKNEVPAYPTTRP